MIALSILGWLDLVAIYEFILKPAYKVIFGVGQW